MGTKRDWEAYNEHLVQRGEILLDLDCLQGWRDELRRMNDDKLGRDFSYPDSLILFLGTLKVGHSAWDIAKRKGWLAASLNSLTFPCPITQPSTGD